MNEKIKRLKQLKDELDYTYRRAPNTEDLNKAKTRWQRYTWATVENPSVLDALLTTIDKLFEEVKDE